MLFEGLAQSLAKCCVAGESRGDVCGVSFRISYKKQVADVSPGDTCKTCSQDVLAV